jgi:hypothetical protein
MTASNAQPYGNAATRLVDYLASQYDESGVSRVAPEDVQFYYKLPAIFAIAGRRRLALQVLDQAMEKFFAGGRFHLDNDPIAAPWMAYLAGWLAWGASMLGRLQVVHDAMDSVSHLQDAQYGGFLHADGSGLILQETERSSAAAMGCIWAAKTENALAAAKFLEYAWKAQPDSGHQFHTNLTLDGRVLPNISDRNTCFRLDDPEARPAIFATTIAFLVWIGESTAHEEFFDLAAAYTGLVRACTHDSATMPLATKIGWAALLIARHRPSPELNDFACRCGEAILKRQLSDGSIGFDEVSDVPKPVAPVWLIGWGCDAALTLMALSDGV